MANVKEDLGFARIALSDKFFSYNEKIERIRPKEFGRLKGLTYLDHSGATLYADSQLEAYAQDLRTRVYGNPHSGNESSRLTADLVDQVRYRVLRHFRTDGDHYSVVFTSGCTASLRLVAQSFDYRGRPGVHRDADQSGSPQSSGTGAASLSCDSGSSGDPERHRDENATPWCDTGSGWGFRKVRTGRNPAGDERDPDRTDVAGAARGSNGGDQRSGVPGIIVINPMDGGVDMGGRRSQGVFCYLQDNHTSVVGMREVAAARGAAVMCVAMRQAENILSEECSKTPEVDRGDVESESGNVFTDAGGNGLFVFPAQSNFSGSKYPLEWIQNVRKGILNTSGSGTQLSSRHRSNVKSEIHVAQDRKWFTLLDAAAFVTSSELDLNKHNADFVAVSFYKMFGFPTGLGALLVRKGSEHLLRKTYFGGGTVKVAIATERFHANRDDISERFEDGTVPFLEILAVRHGLDALERLAGPMSCIKTHTFQLARYVHHSLASYHHSNGTPVAKLYCNSDFESPDDQGPVVTFNLLRSDGAFVGFAEVDKLAQLQDIHVRTGCFCNLGACQSLLALDTQQVKDHFKAGHVCGDDMDLVDGAPTGAIRVSFGYMSTWRDAETLLAFTRCCFLESRPQEGAAIQRDVAKATDMDLPEGGACVVTGAIAADSPGAECGGDTLTIVEDEGRGETAPPSPGASHVRPDVINKYEEPAAADKSHLNVAMATETPGVALSAGGGGWVGTGAGRDGVDAPGGVGTLPTPPPAGHQTGVASGLDPLPPVSSPSTMVLTHIFVYPVKSGGAFEVSQWPLSVRGLLHDRGWMVVNEVGVCLSQKRAPRLCLIKPIIDLETNQLTLQFPGSSPVSVALTPSESRLVDSRLCQSKVCGDRISGEDCGDPVAHWLQKALNPNLDPPEFLPRLVRQQDSDSRTSRRPAKGEVQPEEKGGLSLANEAQYLLISATSVRALCATLSSPDLTPAELEANMIARFRANLVVRTQDTFDEDNWLEVNIGREAFQSQGRCTRCQMIGVDQGTGDRDRSALLGLLRINGRKPTFGVLLRHKGVTTDSILTVGDPVLPGETPSGL